MSTKAAIPPVRILPEEVSNKIAAGEVVERPASVVKELVENALDARATRVSVRLVGAGRRTVEIVDNGHGMSEHDALLAVERHATSKVRKAEDLDNIRTMGFRGEALASIAAVSRFELITRREKDEAACRIRIDGGVLRDVSQVAAPVGTRVSVNRLYFNTPVRGKFLKGVTTELSHCIDTVQRHALAEEGVGFQLSHNDRVLLDIPDRSSLRERIALIWGLNFVQDMIEIEGERGGFHVRGLIGTPALTRAQRSHQFFFINRRPIVNRSLQYGLTDGFRGLLMVGRHPVGVLLIEANPRFVDVNIHPTKREVRFRDERAAHDAIRDLVRARLADMHAPEDLAPQVSSGEPPRPPAPSTAPPAASPVAPAPAPQEAVAPPPRPEPREIVSEAATPPMPAPAPAPGEEDTPQEPAIEAREPVSAGLDPQEPLQADLPGTEAPGRAPGVVPSAMFRAMDGFSPAALQVFDTYLIVPQDDRLLIIDQHALHERLMFDALCADLEDHDYASQQLAVPILVDVPPSHVRLLESNLGLLAELGIEIEPFGGNTFQVTSVCHLYDESRVPDAVYRVLDEVAQGDLFDKENFKSGLLRLTVEACRGAVKAGDRLTPEERQELLDGFQRLTPPYTCPHGRPIVTELTQHQMEKSFRRRV